jgi:hypothetical protein
LSRKLFIVFSLLQFYAKKAHLVGRPTLKLFTNAWISAVIEQGRLVGEYLMGFIDY